MIRINETAWGDMHMLKLVKLKREDYHDFDRYVKTLETEEAAEGLVPDSTYFCLDTDRG